MLSAKWTAVSFFALTALAAGSFAFAGCTVTSGNPDDFEGGTGNPPVGDSSTTPVDGGADTSVPSATCVGNDKQTVVLFSTACQAALNEECCQELKDCFGQAVPAAQDCNVFSDCVDDCKKPGDGGAAPTQVEFDQCVADFCTSNSPASIATAYNAINDCATAKPKSNAACQ